MVLRAQLRGQSPAPMHRSVPWFDLEAVPSSRPCDRDPPSRADAVKVGRRCFGQAFCDASRPHLDGGEHGGMLTAVGALSRGS